MCGINGFSFHDPARLRRMHAATRHRGPDDEGFFESPEMSFAHNRLSIIDLSPGGRQPMTSSDGRCTIVFNGEIYNYRELRAELERLGDSFRTMSDTEVLLLAFMRWGEKALPKLNGIFAFAVWDREAKRLTLARDQLGVKPLYYWHDGARFVFSSELKAILTHADAPREIDREAMNAYFRLLYVPAPRTMYRDIRKLPAGHVATFERGELRVERWWDVTEGETLRDRRAATARVRELVQAAVTRQLVSDRPLGVFLSGGVDSTIVLAAMRAAEHGTIKTFSVGYETDIEREKFNADARLAAMTAKHFGTEHHELTMTAADVAEHLERVTSQMDEPISNHVQTSTFLLAQFAKPTITVALGGDGGDELFGGYPRYWLSAQIDTWRHFPIPWDSRLLAAPAVRMGYADTWQKLASEPGLARFLAFHAQKESSVARFLRPEFNRPQAVHDLLMPFFHDAWRDATNGFMAQDIRTWLPEESLMRTDKLTMAHALEERVPFLDPELVTFAMRIPSAWKLGTRMQGKQILIDAFRDVLPPHVLDQEKRAWMTPAAKWLRGPLLGLAKEILSPSYAPATADYFDFDAIGRMLDDHVAKHRYALNELWSLMTFQIWHKRNL